ncbi:zinc finger MYM-type protein 1-like [Pistacia vera]|uniref:zinc finger MYM-type protein 1-like n=1 Tax=Pistacia vera TaxID=55513 RepID=UPI00126360CC|nr:zinc finger MYM-type protein 1-like [Pistacia vera]
MGYYVCNMDKFLKRKSTIDQSSLLVQENKANDKENDPLKESHVELETILKDLPSDPTLRPKINHYHPKYRDTIQRFYLQKSCCQPRNHAFPLAKFGKGYRRFNPTWFDVYDDWLEYSVTKDAAFCLYCYLFRPAIISQAGSDAFVNEGFCNWKKPERFQIHVGLPNSAHNQARQSCVNLMNQKQHLTASIFCIIFLLRQGLAFFGHDETEDSKNQCSFLGLLHFLAQHNEHFKSVALKNAPGNLKLIAPVIQKDIVNDAANETTKAIISDLGDDIFSVLIDESRDVSIKEQMAIAICYVDKNGHVLERFVGIVHVGDTTIVSLKMTLESLFYKHGLSLSRLRGQGYDEANNIQGEFNGLKSLILRENEYAYYVHCFAHQLQLTLVAVAKKSHFCSCKCRDMLRESQVNKLVDALEIGEVSKGRGLNQETSLKRAGDTRWGSYYYTLINLILLLSSVGDVLKVIEEDGLNPEQRGEACQRDAMLQQELGAAQPNNRPIMVAGDDLFHSLPLTISSQLNASSRATSDGGDFQGCRSSNWKSLVSKTNSDWMMNYASGSG